LKYLYTISVKNMIKRILPVVLLLALVLTSTAQTVAEVPPKPPVITVNVGGFAIARYTYTSNADPSNYLSMRSVRLGVSGRLVDEFEYKAQFKLEGKSTNVNGPQLLDAYVEWQRFKAFRVKIGQFKRAFTFENPTHPIDQGFYGYSMAINKLSGQNDRVGEPLCTGRDLGLQFQGDLLEMDGRPLLHYQIGIYNGQGINMADLNNKKDIIGGFWVMPAQGLRIGASGWNGTYGRTYEGQYAEVKRVRYALSGEYVALDWVFRAEYVHSNGAAFKNPYGGNLDLDETLGDEADAWYALMIAPLIPETLHAKIRYDVYRDSASWDRMYSAYDLGMDWIIAKHLKISAIGSYVNDRRIAQGSHNYFMFDLQTSIRF